MSYFKLAQSDGNSEETTVHFIWYRCNSKRKNIQVGTSDKNGRKKAAERDDKTEYKFMVNSSSCNNLDTVHCIGHKHVILTCLRW